MPNKSPIPHPSEWCIAELKSITKKIGSGATPRGGKEAYIPKREKYALVRSQNIYDRLFDEAGLAFITDDQAKHLKGVDLQENDVLLNITGDGITFGRSCVVPSYALPAVVNQHVAIIRADRSKADPGFILGFLTHPLVKPYIEGHNAGGSRRAITKGHIESFTLALPPLPEQRAIAYILGTLDDKIETNRRMNETLEAMAQALFHDWFVVFGPTRAKMAGQEPYLPAKLWRLFPDRLDDGKIPEGWRLSTIGNEVAVLGGSTPSTKDLNFWEGGINCWVTPKDLSALKFPVLLNTERKITNAGVAQISSGLLPIGTVLLSSRAPIGYIAITEVPTAINQGFIAMKCNGVLPNVFVLFWCRENLNSILGNANGSTFQEISKSNFRPIPIVVPSETLISAYHTQANSLFRRMVENEQENLTLAAIRDALLPKLISGELRIPDAERILANAI